MNKTELYKNELEKHAIYTGWDYLTDYDKKDLKDYQHHLMSKANYCYLDGTNRKAMYLSGNGGTVLVSYETMVCSIDLTGSFHKQWQGYSATSLKHINIFRQKCGLNPLSKREWIMMPIG